MEICRTTGEDSKIGRVDPNVMLPAPFPQRIHRTVKYKDYRKCLQKQNVLMSTNIPSTKTIF